MADLLGATNPVPGYDGASQNRSHSALPQVQDPRVQNVPDLSRVSRADGRTEQQGAGNHLDAGRLRYDSNLQTFLQQLRDAPDLAAVLAKTVVWMRGLVSAPGLSEGDAADGSGGISALFSEPDAGGEPIFRTAVLPAPTGISEHAQRRDAGGYS